MKVVGLTEAAAAALPTLARWLSGAGIACTVADPRDPVGQHAARILHVSERVYANHRDVIIDFTAGTPRLLRPGKGQPAELTFGADDMAFGHALIAELVRPIGHPACGEPESASLLDLAARVAQHDATVLILGETGTGKEGVARYIHAMSPRADREFVAVNCAALPESMLEAILFGHQKGSFTGAAGASEGLFRAADGGTLLLDEVAEIPLGLQAKLLRALQEREVLPIGATRAIPVDVHVIAAANRDLASEVAQGRFRADLYWRLNVLPLTLAPLAHRRLDIRAIAAAMLLRHSPIGKAAPWPTPNALDRLMTHDWPGNARELENVIQRALLLHRGDRIEADDLAIDRRSFNDSPVQSAPRLADAARQSEADAIRAALEATGGHRLRAAERLGISERTLRYRLADMRHAAAA
ncbi:MAG: sigma-54 interaction domain-containing protein [Sphingomonadaceae bacterium]